MTSLKEIRKHLWWVTNLLPNLSGQTYYWWLFKWQKKAVWNCRCNQDFVEFLLFRRKKAYGCNWQPPGQGIYIVSSELKDWVSKAEVQDCKIDQWPVNRNSCLQIFLGSFGISILSKPHLKKIKLIILQFVCCSLHVWLVRRVTLFIAASRAQQHWFLYLIFNLLINFLF